MVRYGAVSGVGLSFMKVKDYARAITRRCELRVPDAAPVTGIFVH